MEANLEMENLGKRSGTIGVCITNSISDIEDTLEDIDTTVKENSYDKIS